MDPRELWQRVQATLAAFKVGEEVRDHPTGYEIWETGSVPLYSLSTQSIDALAATGITEHFEPPQSPRYLRTDSGIRSVPYQHPHYLCLYRGKEPMLWLDEEEDVRVYMDLAPHELTLFLADRLVPKGQYVLTDVHGNLV